MQSLFEVYFGLKTIFNSVIYGVMKIFQSFPILNRDIAVLLLCEEHLCFYLKLLSQVIIFKENLYLSSIIAYLLLMAKQWSFIC